MDAVLRLTVIQWLKRSLWMASSVNSHRRCGGLSVPVTDRRVARMSRVVFIENAIRPLLTVMAVLCITAVNCSIQHHQSCMAQCVDLRWWQSPMTVLCCTLAVLCCHAITNLLNGLHGTDVVSLFIVGDALWWQPTVMDCLLLWLSYTMEYVALWQSTPWTVSSLSTIGHGQHGLYWLCVFPWSKGQEQ